MNPWAVATTGFLASGVEMVEALTIVLAVAYTKGWRPAILGTLAALAVLGAIVALGIPILRFIPDTWIKLGVGAFAVWFGWGWLKKAVLRAAGRKELHDEAAIYSREVAALREARDRRAAFATAFNGVFLEGLEVALIVLTLGSAGAVALAWTLGGAAAALVAVVVAGVALRAPLSRVPENLMKYAVGVMLTTFGVFWLGEGTGMAWPGADLALLVLGAAILGASLLTVAILREAAPKNA